MLRRIPHRTDSVTFGGYSFEVMDIDNYKIDQVLVTRLAEPRLTEPDRATDRSLRS
jgi:CBS domain containing-hemolysin-like protein